MSVHQKFKAMVGIQREASREEEIQVLDSLNDDPLLRLHYGLHVTFQVSEYSQPLVFMPNSDLSPKTCVRKHGSVTYTAGRVGVTALFYCFEQAPSLGYPENDLASSKFCPAGARLRKYGKHARHGKYVCGIRHLCRIDR